MPAVQRCPAGLRGEAPGSHPQAGRNEGRVRRLREALEVLGILLKAQRFSRNPSTRASAFAERGPPCAWPPAWSPGRAWHLASGVRPLAGAAAGGLLGHVLVGGGFQEAGVGVLLHQRARLGLRLVEAGGGGPREVLAGDLPGFVVDVHLQGSSTQKHYLF